MAFTAGSPELTKAIQFANDLAGLRGIYGATAMSGRTAAVTVEKLARNYGFGITGLTTGSGFPPFGTVLPSYNLGLAAALQNPRGETMASGIALGDLEGQTVGIYIKKFIRTGEDYRATLLAGITLATAFTSTATGISANGPFTLNRNDRLVFGNNFLVVGGGLAGGSAASAASGLSANIPLLSSAGFAAAAGDAFDAVSVGVTRGTSGVAGVTSEIYAANTVVNRGFTATVYYNWTSTAGNTWSIR